MRILDMMVKVGVMQLDYIRLHWDKETKRWDRRCVALMQELFDFKYHERLEICHPNDIFKTKPITKQKKDIGDIDWELTMDSYDDVRNNSFYPINIRGDYSGFSYIHSTFRNDLFVDGNVNKRLKTNDPRFLVVFEVSTMRVRAIFRGTKDTFEVAFNPDFIKECSNQSIFNDSATNKL